MSRYEQVGTLCLNNSFIFAMEISSEAFRKKEESKNKDTN